MRLPVIVSLLALACGKPDSTEAGRLVCKLGPKTFEARVPPGALATVRERADQARLTDCHFEPGAPHLARYAIESLAIAPPPPPPPIIDDPPQAPINVPPSILENNRIAGIKQIDPDVDTRLEIVRSGKTKVIGSFKLCIDPAGDISAVSQLKSTGFPDYDGKIIRGLKTWKYMPYIYNGREVSVCTAVTFIYSAP